MTDYFALFDELRRPWLEVEQLKAKFLERSADVHPDKLRNASLVEQEAASRRFAELNSAFNCLREPKERLGHLLQLELGSLANDTREMPPNLADLFMEMLIEVEQKHKSMCYLKQQQVRKQQQH